jgi:Trypsin-co-occurring domain 1
MQRLHPVPDVLLACSAVRDAAILTRTRGDVAMASQVVTYQLDDSTLVRFEIEPPPGFQQASGTTIAGKVRDAIAPAIETAQLVLDRIKDLAPDEVEVTFGLKVSGKLDWLIAKAASEGNFEIKLAWKPSNGQDSSDHRSARNTRST